MVRMGEEVWYASYGSNMWWERFRCYLEGGVPPGATRRQVGARDPSPPSDSRGVALPYRMYFAGRASTWGGGGVAFLDHERLGVDDLACARGRAWRITREQFDDVVAQENGFRPGEIVVDLDGLEPGDTRELPDAGWYRGLLVVDTLDGLPLVTFTSPEVRTDLNPPSEAYLRTIAMGLAECTGMSAEEIGEHLAPAAGEGAGAAGAWTAARIVALLG